MPVSPATLFKTSAVLFALLVPGHIGFGLTNVHPGLNEAEAKPAALSAASLRGLIGARNQWDAWNFWSLGLALLNWHYAGVGAPGARAEQAALLVMLAGNVVAGVRYGARGEWGPAVGLNAASLASLAGLVMGA